MKKIILTLIILFVGLLNNLKAQQITYDDLPIKYHIDNETTSFSCEGDFRDGDKTIWWEDEVGYWEAKVEASAGEVIIMQDYYPAMCLSKGNGVSFTHGFSIKGNGEYVHVNAADTIDNHSVVMKIEKTGTYRCVDLLANFDYGNNDELPDEYFKFSIIIKRIGKLVQFSLRPINDHAQDIADWVKAQAFSPDNTQAEIMWHLTNDLECHATDTYGQEIDLISTYYSWKLDMEKGTAIFTPYFTPRQFKTTWQSGEPFSLLPEGEKIYNKSAPVDDAVSYDDDGRLVLHLWGLGNVTALNQNATETLSASAQNGTISIRGTNGNAVQLYNATGQQIYSGTSTEINVPTAGLYVLKCGSTTQKILVK